MNRSLLGGLGVALVSVAFLSCGSDDEDKPTLASYAAARCAVMQRCSPEMLPLYGGSSRCVERMSMEMQHSVLPGMVTEGDWLSACISALNSAGCEDLYYVEECDPPPGTLPPGSACMYGPQCDTGLCSEHTGQGCGVCISPGALGEACDQGTPCAEGLKCSYTDHVCVQPAALGEPCSSAIPCLQELYCSSTDNVCLQRLALGEPCDVGTPCAEGLDCSFTQQVCVEDSAPGDHKVGDSCSDAYPNSCGTNLRCHNGVCALRVALGGTCSVTSDCVQNTWCDHDKEVCSAIKRVGEGEACDVEGVACADGLWCKNNAVCVAFLEDGAVCEYTSSAGCLLPAQCQDGVCQIPEPPTCE